jgi:ribonuclease VapC
MIVVDTSALIEIIIAGAQAKACMDVLEAENPILMSAGSMLEALVVAHGRKAEAPLNALFDHFGIRIEPVTEERARAAGAAYRRYGKGWHAATLNFSDCFAYALAKEHGCRLLFVGSDFALTDVEPALAANSAPPAPGPVERPPE